MTVDYFGLTIPYLEHLGVVPLSMGDGKASARLPMRPELHNSRGELQGGSIMSVLDFALSAAVRSSSPDATGAATVDMTTSFLAPALSDLTIEARVLKAGGSIVFCEAEARSTSGELVARATGTFRVFRRGQSGVRSGSEPTLTRP